MARTDKGAVVFSLWCSWGFNSDNFFLNLISLNALSVSVLIDEATCQGLSVFGKVLIGHAC